MGKDYLKVSAWSRPFESFKGRLMRSLIYGILLVYAFAGDVQAVDEKKPDSEIIHDAIK